jgi:hypothetical protein
MPPCRRNQAGLADAGRPLDQQQRATTCDRLTQALIDPAKSRVSLQKPLPAIHRSHRR